MKPPKTAGQSRSPPAGWSQRSRRADEAVTRSLYATIFLIPSTSNLKPAKIWFLWREGQRACRWPYHLWPCRSSQNNALSCLMGIWINTVRWLRDQRGSRLFEGRERVGRVNGWPIIREWLFSPLPLASPHPSFHYMTDGWWDKGTPL